MRRRFMSTSIKGALFEGLFVGGFLLCEGSSCARVCIRLCSKVLV